MNEGVVRFRCQWTREPFRLEGTIFETLTHWRGILRKAGLIGILPDGVGFGNISVRAPGPAGSESQAFVVTGSQTGGLERLDPTDYALVTGFALEENLLACTGMTQASSESLSHGAVYRARPDARAVIHIHSALIWEKYVGVLPTTHPALPYGTPELARALAELAAGLAPGGPHALVMGGHRDGLLIFGPTLEEAGSEVLGLAEFLGEQGEAGG